MLKTYLARIAVFFIFISLTATSSFGQLKKGTVKAKLIDATTKQPVEFASIAVAIAKDSTIIRNSTSDKTGTIEFTGLALGQYRLTVYQLGLKPVKTLFALTADKPYADLGDIVMEPSIRNLKEVNISEEKAPVTVKKDTTEFNAGSFKTQPNATVEDLFKKLPGVDVDKDGKITTQGKEVTKVLVDGKEFFGNDPKSVTKNLPADAIAKVQIIDDKTERTKNTGIDDGQRDKVMNITLKEDKKHGWFGNMSAAGGTSDRYLGSFSINHFDKKKQLSFLFLSNNVNESGFTMEDLNNFTNGNTFGAFSNGGGVSINVSSSGRADINNTFGGVTGGLIKNNSGGVNYSDEWGKKSQFKFNSSVIAVVSSNVVNQTSNVQDAPNNLLTDQIASGNNSSYSYRFNFNLNYKPDTLNTFAFKPNFSIVHKAGFSSKQYNSTDSLFKFKNSGNQSLDQATNTPIIGGQLTVNHKFQHGKGSINFFTTNSYTITNADYTNRSLTSYIRNGSSIDSTYNQQSGQDLNSASSTTVFSLVRLLDKKRKLNLNLSQGIDYRKSNADQATLQYNPVNGRYDIFIPGISGNYDNDTYKFTTTVGIGKSGDKISYNINAEVNELGLKGDFTNNNNSSSVKRDNWAFTPNANFSYRQTNGYYLSFGIRQSVTQPSVNDLQPVFNNTNPLYIRQGNPDLKNSNSLNFNANYNKFDSKSNTYFGIYSSYTQTWNGFSTASVIDQGSGIQTSKPINTDGNYNIYLGINMNKPTKLKGLRYSINFNGSANRNVNSVNNADNAVFRLSPQLGTGFNYDRDRVQFGIRNNTTYNFSQNSVQKLADQKYFSFYNSINLGVYPLKNTRIYTDINQNGYTSQKNNPSQYIYLWNAGIDQYFMDKLLTLSLSGFDLLNRNSGLQRFISQTGQITNSQSNTIGQYFYIKLIYKINKVGTKSNGSSIPGLIRL